MASGAAGSPWAPAVTSSPVWPILLIQAFGLRPRLDRRARVILDGATPPRSLLHHLYVVLEVLKALTLVVVGTLLAGSLLPRTSQCKGR
jgi:hypothetical protein